MKGVSGMLLLTAENRRALPALHAQDGKGMDATVYVKLFHPASRWTLFVTEYDGEDLLFGYVLSPLGSDCDELGYASLSELANMRAGAFNLGIERDLHFEPKSIRAAVREIEPSHRAGFEEARA